MVNTYGQHRQASRRFLSACTALHRNSERRRSFRCGFDLIDWDVDLLQHNLRFLASTAVLAMIPSYLRFFAVLAFSSSAMDGIQKEAYSCE